MQTIHILQLIFSVSTTLFLWIFAGITYKMNRTRDLNRCFALYSLFFGFGTLLFGIYHLTLNIPSIIIIVMIMSNFLINIGFSFLLLSVLVVQYQNLKGIPLTYWILIGLAYFMSIIFYFIFTPTLKLDEFADGIVDFNNPLPTFLIENGFRVFIILFSTFQFNKFVKRSTRAKTRQKFMYFKYGNISFILGMVVNLIGGYSTIILEIIGLTLIDLTFLFYICGFKNDLRISK